jgi:hypothetical protein
MVQLFNREWLAFSEKSFALYKANSCLALPNADRHSDLAILYYITTYIESEVGLNSHDVE